MLKTIPIKEAMNIIDEKYSQLRTKIMKILSYKEYCSTYYIKEVINRSMPEVSKENLYTEEEIFHTLVWLKNKKIISQAFGLDSCYVYKLNEKEKKHENPFRNISP